MAEEAEKESANSAAAGESAPRPLSLLAEKMASFGRDADAWQDFLTAVDHILEFHPDGLAMNISVAPALWDYWSVVAARQSSDYDVAGARTREKAAYR